MVFGFSLSRKSANIEEENAQTQTKRVGRLLLQCISKGRVIGRAGICVCVWFFSNALASSGSFRARVSSGVGSHHVLSLPHSLWLSLTAPIHPERHTGSEPDPAWLRSLPSCWLEWNGLPSTTALEICCHYQRRKCSLFLSESQFSAVVKHGRI